MFTPASSPRRASSSNFKIDRSVYKSKPSSFTKPISPSTDYEKIKLDEKRATKTLKDDPEKRDNKGKIGSKRRELKLTISRALSGDEEGRSRSLAALKRAKQKENRIIQKDQSRENLKPVKRDVNIPETITVRDLANRMAEQSSNLIKHLLGMGVTVTINQALAADTAYPKSIDNDPDIVSKLVVLLIRAPRLVLHWTAPPTTAE